jgi:hypothetical protein
VNCALGDPEVSSPPKLREAALRGTLIPFVGAGVSRLAGCPTWAQFADRALQAFVDDGRFSYGQLDQIRHLNPRVKLSIAQGLQAEHKLPINYAGLIDPVGGYGNEIGTPDFDLDDKLKELIKKLASLGYRGDAIRFVEKLRRTLPGMLEFYKNLVSTNT